MLIPNGKHRVAIHLDPATIATAGITADGYGASGAIRRYCHLLELAGEAVEAKFPAMVWGMFLNAITEQGLAMLADGRKAPTEILIEELLANNPKADRFEWWRKIQTITNTEAEAILVAVAFYHQHKKAISLAKNPNWFTVAFRRRRADLVK